MNSTVRCYAYGGGNDWQAICVDLDIATEGKSLDEARESLDACIQMYLERVLELPKEEQSGFLTRKSPLRIRAKLAVWAFLSSLRSGAAFQKFTIESQVPVLS